MFRVAPSAFHYFCTRSPDQHYRPRFVRWTVSRRHSGTDQRPEHPQQALSRLRSARPLSQTRRQLLPRSSVQLGWRRHRCCIAQWTTPVATTIQFSVNPTIGIGAPSPCCHYNLDTPQQEEIHLHSKKPSVRIRHYHHPPIG